MSHFQPPPPPLSQPSHRGLPFIRLRTPPFAHHSIKFSPFFDDKLALASGANFGLIGNGRVYIVKKRSNVGSEGVVVDRAFDTQDCVYDVAWNEAHENQIVAGCGNGALKLFDVTLQGLPIKAWHEHTSEIMSVDWSNLSKHQFATASWDETIKIWSVDHRQSLVTLRHGGGQVYAAAWSPHDPALLISCGQDGKVKVWDIRRAGSGGGPVIGGLTAGLEPGGGRDGAVMEIQAGREEVLSVDWNKYEKGCFATGGKDRAVRIWDMRNAGALGKHRPVELMGHTLTIRRVQWSPHHRDIIASTGYDMSCRLWSTRPPELLRTHTNHTEFSMALSWAFFEENLIATAGWDQELHLFQALDR